MISHWRLGDEPQGSIGFYTLSTRTLLKTAKVVRAC